MTGPICGSDFRTAYTAARRSLPPWERSVGTSAAARRRRLDSGPRGRRRIDDVPVLLAEVDDDLFLPATQEPDLDTDLSEPLVLDELVDGAFDRGDDCGERGRHETEAQYRHPATGFNRE
jgi:hypothetical protein